MSKSPQISPLVYVIVVNFNGMRWLERCLETLYATNYDNFRVIVVDNNSSDGSVAFIESAFPKTELAVNDQNLGFCEGNNVGIEIALKANADYIVLLNSDTESTKDWLTELVAVGEQHPSIGVLGSVQMEYAGSGFNSWTVTVAQEHLAELSNPDTARSWIPMRWVEGSCFAVKRGVIEEVGLLDPIYFMYYEEIDYCRRVTAHGYDVALVPRSRIHHFRGGTSKVDKPAKRARDRRFDRSHLIFHATDLQRVFALNLCRYFLTVGYKCFESIKVRRYYRVWDVLRLQPELLKSLGAIRRKWKRDRQRLRGRANLKPRSRTFNP